MYVKTQTVKTQKVKTQKQYYIFMNLSKRKKKERKKEKKQLKHNMIDLCLFVGLDVINDLK